MDDNDSAPQPDPNKEVRPGLKGEAPASPAIVKRTQIKAPKGTGAASNKDHDKQIRDLQTKQSELEDRQSNLESWRDEVNNMFSGPGRSGHNEQPSDIDKDIFGD